MLFVNNMSMTNIALVPADFNTEKLAHCDANSFTDAYGLLVQAILAFFAFCCLILKRFLEPADQRRPWSIWIFDTSKQAVGATVIHMLNVFLAPLFSNDPCTWYIVSFLLDSTVGLLIIYVGVKVVSCVARICLCPTLRFGEYGKPPQCRPWLHQCLVFIFIICIEKIIMTIVVSFQFWRDVRRWILSPIKNNPKLEVTIVMLIVPFVVNSFMFWVVDNFTMRKQSLRTVSFDDDRSLAACGNKYGEQINTHDDSLQALLDDDNGTSSTIPQVAIGPHIKSTEKGDLKLRLNSTNSNAEHFSDVKID